MRINISTVFQVLALIAQDVLAFEAEQTKPRKESTTPTLEVPEVPTPNKLST